MIESLKIKRFKVCFKILEDDKLQKKFMILEGKTETEIKSLIVKEYGDMDYYSSRLDEDHIEPGIIYINQVDKVRDGEITRN